MESKCALVIGNDEYQDPKLSQLISPSKEAKRLAELLRLPEVGGFDDVNLIVNEPEANLRRAISRFLSIRKRDDLALIYFSGHGILDEQGLLYFAAKDTENDALNATAISAHFIRHEMNRSYSRRQILILDCCNSGAFARTRISVGASVGTGVAFDVNGYGRVVITATDATQYAWEDDKITGEASASAFTRFLLLGLETGVADRDNDGFITIDELYDYVYERVVHTTPKQTPVKFADKQQGNIVIARNPSINKPVVPIALQNAFESRFAGARIGAAKDIESLLHSDDINLVQATRFYLAQLALDDNRPGYDLARQIMNSIGVPATSNAIISPPENDGKKLDIRSANSTSTISDYRDQVAQIPWNLNINLGVDSQDILWKLPEYTTILPVEKSEVLRDRDAFDQIYRWQAHMIETTLENFNAPAKVVEINVGPSVAEFGIEPDFIRSGSKVLKVKVSDIVALESELSEIFRTQIRIVAPVPGKGYIGIEIPVQDRRTVLFQDAMLSSDFSRLHSRLRIVFGQNTNGDYVVGALDELRHMFIAGMSGSGKSSFLQVILATLLLQNTPDELRLLLINPKHVDLTLFEDIPHLLTPIVSENYLIVGLLRQLLQEILDRYAMLEAKHVRNINEYNRLDDGPTLKKMPYILVIVDDLASTLPEDDDEIVNLLSEVTRQSHHVGVHVIVATQRISANSVAEMMRYYFPTRLAFAMQTLTESQAVLNQAGAEKLLRSGDYLLVQSLNSPQLLSRLQSPYLSVASIQAVADYWRNLWKNRTDDNFISILKPVDSVSEGDEQLFRRAVQLIRETKKPSVSLLQRRLNLGYPRAARIMDLMEKRGIVGPVNPSSMLREVLDSGGDT